MNSNQIAKNMLVDHICATCEHFTGAGDKNRLCKIHQKHFMPYDSCGQWKIKVTLTQEEIDEIVETTLLLKRPIIR